MGRIWLLQLHQEAFAFSICTHGRERGVWGGGVLAPKGLGGLGGSFALASGEKLDLLLTRVKQTPCRSVPFGQGYLWGEGGDKGRGRKLK